MPLKTPAWPESPMVYGYLTLDERGQWLIRGRTISRPSLVEHLQRHYQSDGAGRWFVKNGWQQAFVTLDYLPRVLRVTGRGDLIDHCQRPIDRVTGAVLDEAGALVLDTPDGPGLVDSSDLAWALERLKIEGGALTDNLLGDALQVVSGEMTALTFSAPAGNAVPVHRVDRAHMATHFSFVPNPRPEPRTTESGQ